MLVWSILLYAFSAAGSGFATSIEMLLVLRCLTFVGVCVEFVAAVAWLAELFPEREQRETVLGYTQAFSSFGGLLVSAAYYVAVTYGSSLPAIHGDHHAWRYTLISGLIPAIPLIVIRPFPPESPAWQQKKDAGTLKRPSIAELFHPSLRRATIVTTIMFACRLRRRVWRHPAPAAHRSRPRGSERAGAARAAADRERRADVSGGWRPRRTPCWRSSPSAS